MTRVFEAFAKDGVILLPEDVPSPARCLVAILDEDLQKLREDAAAVIPEDKQQLDKNKIAD